ncbi:MAG: DUF3486 family protein [Desulfobacterales bacterium]|jgi:hypothetical protein|nr:DUF3486 family protein [Desulfobacterales bacterium]
MAKKKRIGRGQLSTVDRIPEDIRVEINAELRSRRKTQQEILQAVNPLLEERGERPLTRSALNRYAMWAEEKNTMMRQAREAANTLVGGLGEQTGTDLGRAVTELVKTLTFDLILRAQDGDSEEPIDVDTLNKVALIAQRIELASKTSLDRETAIRDEAQKQERERLKAKTMGAMAEASQQTGGKMSSEMFKKIIMETYGA